MNPATAAPPTATDAPEDALKRELLAGIRRRERGSAERRRELESYVAELKGELRSTEAELAELTAGDPKLRALREALYALDPDAPEARKLGSPPEQPAAPEPVPEKPEKSVDDEAADEWWSGLSPKKRAKEARRRVREYAERGPSGRAWTLRECAEDTGVSENTVRAAVAALDCVAAAGLRPASGSVGGAPSKLYEWVEPDTRDALHKVRDWVLTEGRDHPFDRSEVAEALGLAASPTVSAALAKLTPNVVREAGTRPPKGGKGKPAQLYEYVEQVEDDHKPPPKRQPPEREAVEQFKDELPERGGRNLALRKRPHSHDKDLDAMIDKAHRAGWEVKPGGTGHVKCRAPERGEIISVPQSPTKQRTVRRIRSAFRRNGLDI